MFTFDTAILIDKEDIMPRAHGTDHQGNSFSQSTKNCVWNKRKIVTTEELAISNMYMIEALIRILERKGITSKNQVLAELKKMKEEDEKED